MVTPYQQAMPDVFGWVACQQLRIDCSPLASLDPAVYPGPVRHLGRGEEEGATADPGLKSSRVSRTFQDREGREEVAGDFAIQSAQSSPQDVNPPPTFVPFCWQNPCFSYQASAHPIPEDIKCYKNFVPKFSLFLVVYSWGRGYTGGQNPPKLSLWKLVT